MSAAPHARLRVELVAIERPAAAHLDRIVGKRVVPLDGAEDAHEGQTEARARSSRHHQESFGAGARHHAIEQFQRIGDRAGAKILVERSAAS